jgi:hypothetical protein
VTYGIAQQKQQEQEAEIIKQEGQANRDQKTRMSVNE